MFLWQRIYARPEVGVFTTVASATVLHHNTSPDFLEEVLWIYIVNTQISKNHKPCYDGSSICCISLL